MSLTHPVGLSCSINRKIVLLTVLLSGSALLSLFWANATYPTQFGYKAIIYGLSLFLCAFFSYLYTVRFSFLSVAFLRQLDHSAIFFLIAGTYTPFLSQDIRCPFGVPMISLVWGLALVGICLRLVFRGNYDRLFVGLYLALGWLFLLAFPDIMHQVPKVSLVFLGTGVAVYSLGAAIFAKDIGKWTDPVWHGCVLSASGLHFVAVLSLGLWPRLA